MNENPPVPVPPAPPHVPRFNKAAGATNGPYSGNIRAALAMILTVGFLCLFGYLAVEYLAFGKDAARPLVEQGWGAILATFGLISGLYFGARIAQGG